MKIEINIPDERIVELVEQAIVENMLDGRRWENNEARHGVRSGMDKAMEYEQKAEEQRRKAEYWESRANEIAKILWGDTDEI